MKEEEKLEIILSYFNEYRLKKINIKQLIKGRLKEPPAEITRLLGILENDGLIEVSSGHSEKYSLTPLGKRVADPKYGYRKFNKERLKKERQSTFGKMLDTVSKAVGISKNLGVLVIPGLIFIVSQFNFEIWKLMVNIVALFSNFFKN